VNTKKFFIFGTLIIFLFSSLNHFLYKWSNFSPFIAFIAPVNESLFQHAKMFFYPCVLYYLLVYIIFSSTHKINYKIWFFLPILVFLTTFVIVFGTYYIFYYLFKMQSMIIDICSLFIGLSIGNILSYQLYKKRQNILLSPSICLFLILGISIIFTSWTTKPPKEQFFYDENNQTYQRVYK